MKWTTKFKGASLLGLFMGTAGAQLSLLTPREAVQVVGLIPEVAGARKQGFCPTFSASYGDTVDKLGVQVRYGCGPQSGQWINNYEIDLGTGAVFGQGGKQMNNPDVDALAKTLLEQARARVLSSGEARCLALEAAKSLPGWGGPGREVSVEPFGAFGLRFHARLRAQDPPMVAERFLTIDRSTARVHDDETGVEVVTASLATLASKMLILHLPSILSEADALEIARQIPEVRAQALKPCSVFSVGGPLSWENILVGVQSHCEGAPDESHLVVAIDPRTGAVTNPGNQKHLGSPAAARIAQERLEGLDHEKVIIREDLAAACRAQ